MRDLTKIHTCIKLAEDWLRSRNVRYSRYYFQRARNAGYTRFSSWEAWRLTIVL